MSEHDLDDISRFEAKETSRALPAGWLLLFWGLIAFGAYYLWAYWLSGWRQGDVYAEQVKATGPAGSAANVVATILFTALPTLAAVLIVLAQRRKKRV